MFQFVDSTGKVIESFPVEAGKTVTAEMPAQDITVTWIAEPNNVSIVKPGTDGKVTIDDGSYVIQVADSGMTGDMIAVTITRVKECTTTTTLKLSVDDTSAAQIVDENGDPLNGGSYVEFSSNLQTSTLTYYLEIGNTDGTNGTVHLTLGK